MLQQSQQQQAQQQVMPPPTPTKSHSSDVNTLSQLSQQPWTQLEEVMYLRKTFIMINDS